jgi:hypothetical protein
MTAEAITPNDEVTALSDRQLLERVAKQLDHLDCMVHDQGQLIGQLAPLLPHVPRALTFLDPAGAMRKHWRLGKGDGP